MNGGDLAHVSECRTEDTSYKGWQKLTKGHPRVNISPWSLLVRLRRSLVVVRLERHMVVTHRRL